MAKIEGNNIKDISPILLNPVSTVAMNPLIIMPNQYMITLPIKADAWELTLVLHQMI